MFDTRIPRFDRPTAVADAVLRSISSYWPILSRFSFVLFLSPSPIPPHQPANPLSRTPRFSAAVFKFAHVNPFLRRSVGAPTSSRPAAAAAIG